MLPSFRTSATARSLHFFITNRHDLDLNPPYQRGEVWGTRRKRALVFSLLTGVPVPSVVVNDRSQMAYWDAERDPVFAVVDGKQRITALRDLVDGVFTVPGDWFGADADEVRFMDLPVETRRHFLMRPFSVVEGRLETVEAERELFDLLNFGGLAQGEVDED